MTDEQGRGGRLKVALVVFAVVEFVVLTAVVYLIVRAR